MIHLSNVILVEGTILVEQGSKIRQKLQLFGGNNNLGKSR